MSQPGWYPDPAGTPGRFRYWDGASWSHETTADPTHSPAPGQAGATGPGPLGTGTSRDGSRRPAGPLLAVLAALLVLALLVWWFGFHRRGGGAGAPEDTSTARPTVSAWNETGSPTPAPSASDDPQPSNGVAVSCPDSTPMQLSHPDDGRLHGGHVSVEALPSPWQTLGGLSAGAPRWSVDTAQQERPVVQSWVSSSLVGALVRADGFTAPHQAADAFMSCYASSSFYEGFTGRTDLVSQAVTVDGHPGWWLRSQVRVVFASDPSITGDTVDIVVLDTGDAGLLSFWEGNATIGDTAVQAQVDQVRGTLRVDG